MIYALRVSLWYSPEGLYVCLMQGVMLTHANILSVVAGQLSAINQVAGRYGEKFNQDDVMISYLPLAHIFDR